MPLPALLRRPLEEGGLLQPLAPVQSVAPIREASPEEPDAQPVEGMISRSGESAWLPASYLGSIKANPDTVLARSGQGLAAYDKLLSDDSVFSALQQRRLAITSRDWEVTPGQDDDPRSVQAADEFRAMLNAVGFDRVTALLHYSVWYGYGVAEAIYAIREHDGRLIVWLDDIVVPNRRWFAFTMTGELKFIGEAGAVGLGDEGAVPPNKFLTIRTGGTDDFAFYGLGLAHWCYWPIFFKRSAQRYWALYLERYGQPTTGIEFTATQKDDKQARADLLAAAVAVGRDSAILVPEGTLSEERIKVLESSRTGGASSSYKEFLDRQDEAIMRVVLGQPGTSKGVKSGLNSNQATEHAEVKREIVKADADLISEAIERTFAKWLTTWNHGADVCPPKVRRVLDDGETLDQRAQRDVELDGIGIKLDDQGIQEVYGDRYHRETPPPPVMLPGAVPGQPSNVVDLAQARAARAAQFAAQGGTEAFGPLYVSRKLLNAAELIAWAKGQGFKVTAPADDLHVTILYSKTPVDWFAVAGDWTPGQNSDGTLTVERGGPRFVERFGPSGNDQAVVLRFGSSDLRYRHESMIERGASSDFPDFKPHVTISYDGADVDLSKVEPFDGALRFGPEIFEPIKAPNGEDGFHAFTAADEEAIDRLVAQLTADADPVFEAMATELRGSLQGVTTVEQARVAILTAVERLPVDRLARLTALPMLAERAGALIGAEADVTA